MKRILCGLLAVLLSLSLAACSTGGAKPSDAPPPCRKRERGG
jgi:hypothetical protein